MHLSIAGVFAYIVIMTDLIRDIIPSWAVGRWRVNFDLNEMPDIGIAWAVVMVVIYLLIGYISVKTNTKWFAVLTFIIVMITPVLISEFFMHFLYYFLYISELFLIVQWNFTVDVTFIIANAVFAIPGIILWKLYWY